MDETERQSLKRRIEDLERENLRLKKHAPPEERTITTENEVKILFEPRAGEQGARPNVQNAGQLGVAPPSRFRNNKYSSSQHVPTISTHFITEGKSEPILLEGGIEVVIHGSKRIVFYEETQHRAFDLLNEKLSVWCEVKSTEVDCDLLVVAKSSEIAEPVSDQYDFCFVDYIQVNTSVPSFTTRRSCSEKRTNIMAMPILPNEINCTLKVIRMNREERMQQDDSTVTVMVEEEKFEVNPSLLSMWSEFFKGYFRADMKEKESGVYPVTMCTAIEFHELLLVISPSSKPIHFGNVERMLSLATTFIMPDLVRKCENFLSSCLEIPSISLLVLADRYNLFFSKMAILERYKSTEQLRFEVLGREAYRELSNEMKRAIDARYVQLDLISDENSEDAKRFRLLHQSLIQNPPM